MSADEKVFVRKASGVRRDAGALDTFLLNSAWASLGISLAYMFLLGPSFYFGANMLLGTILAAIGAFFVIMTYYVFSAMMPYSGSEYAFVSRTLHPSLGFVASFNFAMWLPFYLAQSADFTFSIGLGPLLDSVGRATSSDSLINLGEWLASRNGSFLGGTAVIILIGLVMIAGLKPLFRLQTVLITIAFISSFLVIALFFANSNSDFVTAFNNWDANPGHTYDEIIGEASATGWENPGFNLKNSTFFLIWPFYAIGFTFVSASIGAEVKKAERNQLIGMVGSFLFLTVLIILTVIAAVGTLGYDFIGAIGWNTYISPEYSTALQFPWVHYLSTALTNNVWLIALIGLGFTIWAYSWVPAEYLYTSRAIFSWSLDRILPDQVSYVSEKYRTPVYAIVITGIMAEIYLILWKFTDRLSLQVGVLGLLVTFLMMGVSALVFPYVKKDIFEKSAFKQSIGSIPLLSLLGLGTIIFTIITMYIFAVDDNAAANNASSILMIVAILAAGFVVFFVSRFYRKRQGVDVDLYFQELPVE